MLLEAGCDFCGGGGGRVCDRCWNERGKDWKGMSGKIGMSGLVSLDDFVVIGDFGIVASVDLHRKNELSETIFIYRIYASHKTEDIYKHPHVSNSM